MMFREFHFTVDSINIGVSALYVFILWLAIFLERSNHTLVVIHIIFAFFPLHQVWQLNMYLFVVFTVFCIIHQYSHCSMDEMLDDSKYLYVLPFLKYYMYLRIDDYLAWLGFFQLLWDYVVFTFIPEKKALEEVQRILSDI